MAKAKSTARRNTKKRRTELRRNHLVIGIVALMLVTFSGFQLGYLGIQLANILRIFVGNTYLVCCIVFVGLAIYYMVTPFFSDKISDWRIIPKKIISFKLTYFSILIMAHILLFQHIKERHPNILAITWDALVMDLKSGKVEQNVGGGMLGALGFSVTHFLVATPGSWILSVLLLIVGICLFFNIGVKEISTFVHNIMDKIALSPEEQAHKDELKAQKQQLKEAKRQEKEAKRQEKIEKELAKRIPQDSNTPTVSTVETNWENEEWQEPSSIEPFSIEPVKQQAELPKVSLANFSSPLVPTQEKLDLEEEETFHEKKHPTGNYESSMGAVLGEEQAEEARKQEEVIESLGIQELENPNYSLPQTSLLDTIPPTDQQGEVKIAESNMDKLRRTFESFKVDAQIVNAQIGPSVTKFEVKPAIGVPVSRFKKMTDDIQLALGARDLRMEAPIPGKSLIGIEVPNEHVSPVSFRDIAEKMTIQPNKLLEVPLGRDIYGEIQTMDLASMPHLLIAGATGSGKSVAVNGIITSLLLHAKPHEVKMVMVDPKMVELSVYNGIPHLLTPVVTNPKKASIALNKVVEEMERRYELFAQFGIRKMESYNAMVDFKNAKLPKDAQRYGRMPYIVVIVDEMADLMMVSGKEVEAAIVRLAQKARAAGIHMILATQRPSVDVITGLIKANIPSRMAFAVSSGVDSRTILDQQGAEKLLGKGDMLYAPIGASHPIRVQGAFLSDSEVERVVEFVKTQQEVVYNENFDTENVSVEETQGTGGGDVDSRYQEIREYVIRSGKASKSEWQRVFKMNFNTATNVMDQLEREGIVGPDEGKKPRKVLVSGVSEETIDESKEPY